MISKKTKIKAIQSALGTAPDGIIGNHTVDVLYRQFASPEMPYELSAFGCKVVITKPSEVTLYDTGGMWSVKDFSYSMSGGFTAPSGVKPCSMLIDDGQVLWGRACHANTWDGEKPEGVLYYTNQGKLGTRVVRLASELDDLDIKWAIGGLTMLPYFNAEAEGFVGRFSDVFRYTAHNAIGYDRYGNIIGVYHNRCTLQTFRQKCKNIGLVEAISLDGGHISAFNCGTLTANVHQKQGSIVSFG